MNSSIPKKTSKSFSIKEWDVADRPREKMMEQGAKILSNAELMAIIIGSGTDEESAIELMKRILASVDNNINKLYQLSLEQLTFFRGIGMAKAVKIKAALELSKRFESPSNFEKKALIDSQVIFNIIKIDIADLTYEEFWVLYLNQSRKLLKKVCISKGGFSKTTVDVRIILKKALEVNAVAIILAHNHPSGSLLPSNSDELITHKIGKASANLDIHLLDHLIVSGDRYYSFKDKNKI